MTREDPVSPFPETCPMCGRPTASKGHGPRCLEYAASWGGFASPADGAGVSGEGLDLLAKYEEWLMTHGHLGDLNMLEWFRREVRAAPEGASDGTEQP